MRAPAIPSRRVSAQAGRELVVAADGDERRRRDAVEVGGAVPVAQAADDVELGRAVHGQVDLVALELVGRPLQRLGPGVEPADVAAVELLHRLAVLGPVVLAAGAELDQGRSRRLGQLLDQPPRLARELGDARRRRGEHEPGDPLRSAAHVLDREPAAPRLPEQVAALEAERVAHLVDLLAGAVERPQRRVVRLVRAAAAELVVDDRRAVGGQALGQRLDVVARRAGAAVQDEQRHAVAVAVPPVPDAPARDVDRAFLAHASSLDERARSELTAEEKRSLGRPSRLPAGIRTAAHRRARRKPEPIGGGY